LSVSPSCWGSEDDDPEVLEIVSDERQKVPPALFLDFGPPLPSSYDVDQLELMVQSPLRVFAYWELRAATVVTALRSVPIEDRQNFQLLLRWNEIDSARERWLDPGTTDSWWFDTLPENRYRLELGLYWSEYGWIPLLVSRELVTPRLALGPAADWEPPETLAFLQDLVQQTGIGCQQDNLLPLSTLNAGGQVAECDPGIIEKPPSGELHRDGPIRDIGQVALTSRRPTSW